MNPVFDQIEIGLGTWAWGDRLVWGYGDKYSGKEIEESFYEALQNGIRFFDTAEVYGQGRSEQFLGKMIPASNEPIRVATKFMPYPWRFGKNALRNALKGSLDRLGIQKVDLYQIHWPLPPIPMESWMQQLADVYEDGLISAAGVSNYDLNLTKRAVEALDKRGIALASNQVEYNLLDRKIEKNGLLDYCMKNDIKVIAYSPLAMGMLSGKYTPENPPHGTRASQYNRAFLEKIQPLIRLLRKIGNEHEGKTASQVSLNWIISKGALPIPGAKNADQVIKNSGAVGWKLLPEEINQLDEMSDQVGN